MERVKFEEIAGKLGEHARKAADILMDSRSSGEPEIELIELAIRYQKKHNEPMPEWVIKELRSHGIVGFEYGK